MFHIVEKRRWYFLVSALVILIGLAVMIYNTATTGTPFRLAIDFTGGSLWQLQFDRAVPPAELRQIFVDSGIEDPAVTTLGDGTALQVRLQPIDEVQKLELFDTLKASFPSVSELQFSSVGPAIGQEVTNAALLAILAAAVVILGFMVFAFRKVPHPIRYGTVAIVAMFHDLLLTLGLFSIVSLVLGWQADALFLTALLTVMSFSMQDKIVVFDRIRENAEVPGRVLHVDRQPQHHGNDPSIACHSAERDLHHGQHPALRRRDDQAVHRRHARGPAVRNLLVHLHRRADARGLDRARLAGQEGCCQRRSARSGVASRIRSGWLPFIAVNAHWRTTRHSVRQCDTSDDTHFTSKHICCDPHTLSH